MKSFGSQLSTKPSCSWNNYSWISSENWWRGILNGCKCFFLLSTCLSGLTSYKTPLCNHDGLNICLRTAKSRINKRDQCPTLYLFCISWLIFILILGAMLQIKLNVFLLFKTKANHWFRNGNWKYKLQFYPDLNKRNRYAIQ